MEQQQQPLPPPPLLADMMPSSVISPGARISLLISCLVIIAALQYPLILSYVKSLSYFQAGNAGAAETGFSGDRGRLLEALAGYSQYKQRAANGLSKKRSVYNKLGGSQKSLVASSVKYITKVSRASKAVEANNKLARAIRDYGMQYYNITRFELRTYEKLHKNAGESKHSIQAMKHFIRDWSEEGKHERIATFPQILDSMNEMYPRDSRQGVRVLVPGAGLGRMSYELAKMGFDVVANEYSMYVNLAYRYMLSLNSSNAAAKPEMHVFHPNINWWSHQRTTDLLLRGVTFPDVIPDQAALGRITMVEGDFVVKFMPFFENGGFDSVVTLFFIDTARNIVSYLETIYKVLKPGGMWVNLGPLLYGTAPWIELSLDEVLKVAEKIGFDLQPIGELWGEDTFPEVPKWSGKVRGKAAGYSWDRESLTRNAYLAQGWIARKR